MFKAKASEINQGFNELSELLNIKLPYKFYAGGIIDTQEIYQNLREIKKAIIKLQKRL